MLKSEFKNFIPIERPIVNTENIPNPNWIAGFVSGDGNFDVNITPAQAGAGSTHKIGYRAQLRFRISQPLQRSSPPSCVCGARARSILIFILK
jgi:hypothetical protein